MNIAVDYGNTIAKVGFFEGSQLFNKHFFTDRSSLQSFLASSSGENIIVSSVSFPSDEVLSWPRVMGKKISLSPDVSLPLHISYETPQTLGVDRIAAVCGALDLYPDQNCLVIDAGTCITYEFLDAQRNYHGGAISPGVTMRYEAMHDFTAKLPLAKFVNEAPLIGNSTEACLQSGVVNGTKAEITGIIQRYQELYPEIRIILCGGDARIFEAMLGNRITAAPDLVLAGLNKILRHMTAR
jgi:type III pantothenate kinase